MAFLVLSGSVKEFRKLRIMAIWEGLNEVATKLITKNRLKFQLPNQEFQKKGFFFCPCTLVSLNQKSHTLICITNFVSIIKGDDVILVRS